MNRYLLEIGVEELPARFVEIALSQLKDKTAKLLKENEIDFGDVEVYATPRRLTVIVDEISLYQNDLDIVSKGPSKKISFDENNEPTKPLIGFMKSQGIELSDIEIKELKGEEYVYANIHKKGESVEKILSENIPTLIKDINFPKNMKWGGKNIKFARPIRWVISLLNDKIVEFDFENIPVGNVTRGHRFLGSSNIGVDHVDNYEKLLEENYVILNQTKRREIIKYGSNKLAKSLGGELYEDEDLLEELTYIVEYPTPIMGRIKDEYLELPKDVITTPMRDHLRYIPVHDAKGELLPYFITIRNGNEEYKEIVVSGNEKVLEARLEDAKFFYRDDVSRPLEDYVEELKGVMFQDKLGTMYDKSIRIGTLSAKIGEYLEVADETIEALERAAYLSKADLNTKTVQEFTELQGAIGKIYAEKSGESKIVSQAIYEQYLPRHSKDSLPKSTTGSILAIADKIDTIVGLFAIGLIPTGSQDPFALRRSAIGIINIINNNKWEISLSEIVDYALYVYTEEMTLVFDYNKVKESILEFLKGRIKNMLQDENIRYDIIDSILSTEDNVTNIFKKCEELNEYFKENDTDKLVESLNRLHNLAKKSEGVAFKEELLSEDAEKELHKKAEEILPRFIVLVDKKSYKEAMHTLSLLIEPINEYFDNIMVIVDDIDIKNNRLAMLSSIDEVVKNILNIEKIVTD